MNDRQRRHQTRRGSSTHQNHHQNHSRSTSHHNHHGHRYQSSSGGGGGYRHPTTMVSGNDGGSPMGQASTSGSSSTRSQLDQANNTRCGVSICYSYLVAIISSILVVLGIYLTMTKFNLRYLYISLVGLLFEAIGACVYCFCNLKANTSARRKTATISSNDFIQLSAANSNSIGNVNLLNSSQHPITNTSQQRQQLSTTTTSAGGATITHILSNGTLTGRTSMDNELPAATSSSNHNDGDNNNEDNTLTAIVIDNNNDNNTAAQTAQQQQAHENANSANSISSIPSNAAASKDNHTDVAPLSTVKHELPKNNAPFQQGLNRETGEFSSATSLLGNHRDEEDEHGEASEVQQPHESVVVDKTIRPQTQINNLSQTTSDNTTSLQTNPITPESGSSHNSAENSTRPSALSRPDLQEASTSAGEQLQNSDDLTNTSSSPISQQSSSGSGGLRPSDATDSAAVRKNVSSSSRQQRQANLRQTLVMGLGGEEEMIEIDEDDLDNMSILPPPYESIAAETSLNQQQFTDI